MDRLEKVTRHTYALPKSKVVAGQDSDIKLLIVVQCCPETPVLGGKHVKPSKFYTAPSQDNSDVNPVLRTTELRDLKSIYGF